MSTKSLLFNYVYISNWKNCKKKQCGWVYFWLYGIAYWMTIQQILTLSELLFTVWWLTKWTGSFWSTRSHISAVVQSERPPQLSEMSCQRRIVLEAIVLQNSVHIISWGLQERSTETVDIPDAVLLKFVPHVHNLTNHGLVGESLPIAFWGGVC